MSELTTKAKGVAWQQRQAAALMVKVAVELEAVERENAEWREWCTKVAHAVGFAEGSHDIGEHAASEANHIGSQAIRRAILGRLHERNAERNAALAKLEAAQ